MRIRNVAVSGIYWFSLNFLLFQSLTVSAKSTAQFSVAAELGKAVAEKRLHFPLMTQRIYRKHAYQSFWFNSDALHHHLWSATELISNSAHYGLDQADYHCDRVTAGNINSLLHNEETVVNKPWLDVLLTDAMITFICDLHYGKANPAFPKTVLDDETFNGLKADSVLQAALSGATFREAVLGVQPLFKGYRELLDYNIYLVGQLSGDCYEIPPDTIKLIALNLERWRWLNSVSDDYIIINLAAFTLNYNRPDGSTEFRIITGEPLTPTPVLQSQISFFTTMPEWNVPRRIIKKRILPAALKDPSYLENNDFKIYTRSGRLIEPTVQNLRQVRSDLSGYVIRQYPGCDHPLGSIMFNLDRSGGIYIHEAADKGLFKHEIRALSKGCIQVEDPERLANLFVSDNFLLNQKEIHQAIKEGKHRKFILSNPVPVIISYFTCEAKNGVFKTFRDVYNRDRSLAEALKF